MNSTVLNQPSSRPGNGLHPVLKYRSRRSPKTLLVASIAFMLLSLGGILADYDLGTSWMTFQAVSIAIFIILVLYCGWVEQKTFYLFSTAYLIVFLLFHVSHTFLHALGVYDLSAYLAGKNSRMFELGGWYIFLAMTSFVMGVSFGRSRNRAAAPTPRQITLTLTDTHWAGVGLLVASILLFALTWFQIGNIFQYSRAQIFGGVGDTRGFSVFLMAFPSALTLLVIGAKKGTQRRTALITALFGTAFIMFLGYRSNALFPAILGVFIWSRTGRKIPGAIVVALLFVVLLVIPTVGYLRSLGSYEKLTGKDIAASFEAAKAQDTFLELGAISGIVSQVIEWIPAEEDYRYGRTYLRALGEAIPNISAEARGNERKRVHGVGGYSQELAQSMSPSDWYIYKVNRWMYDTGGGSGFSAVAEAYLNFGLLGVIGIFAMYGFFFGRLDVTNLLNSSWRLTLAGAVLWPFLTTIRNDFDTFVKPASFILLIIVIWHFSTFWIAQRWRKRRTHIPRQPTITSVDRTQ